LQLFQNSGQINRGNFSDVRCVTSKILRNKNREYLKETVRTKNNRLI